MQNKILILGDIVIDIVINVPYLPQSGKDVNGQFQSYNVGGSAFNVYGALKYTGATSDLLVPIGKGPYANIIKKVFSKKRIPILVKDKPEDNGRDLCLIEPNGQRTFINLQGINQLWSSSWFKKINLYNYKYFYISGYGIENQKSAQIIFKQLKKRRKDSYILFDASPRIKHINFKIINDLLKQNTLVHCNQDELKYLSNKTTFNEKIFDIYQKTKSPVIVTLGAKGTLVYDNLGKRIIKAKHVDVINTIGAGDTHCGGVLNGLQQGMNIDEAIKLGNRLSSKVIRQESGSL